MIVEFTKEEATFLLLLSIAAQNQLNKDHNDDAKKGITERNDRRDKTFFLLNDIIKKLK